MQKTQQNNIKMFRNFIIFLKRFGFLNRLVVVGVLILVLVAFVIPDINYQLSQEGEPELSLKELMSMENGDIPQYFTISDELFSNGDYVEERNEDTEMLNKIEYPVFLLGDTVMRNVQVIVEDMDADEERIADESYFLEASTRFRGKFKGGTVDSDTKRILKEAGYEFGERVIVLEYNKMPLSLSTNIMMAVGLLLLIALGVLSFVPSSVLMKETKSEQFQEEVVG